jgi:hypothetical protein
MGLQMTYTVPDGTMYPQCFVFIATIQLAPSVMDLPSNATLFVNFYADQHSMETGGLPVCQSSFSPEPSIFYLDGNPFDIGYDYLLTLPEFSGAVIVRDN